MKIIALFLTCTDQTEANTICSILLEKRLIACAKMMPVTAKFLWKESVNTAHEILLIMESEKGKFDHIEQEIKKIHSYKTFVLTAVEVSNVSSGVSDWLQECLISSKNNCVL